MADLAIGRAIVGWLLSAAAAFALLTGVVYLVFDSPDAAVAYFRGEHVSIRPNFIDLGSGSAGETRTIEVQAINRTDETVRIIGGTSDCSGVAIDDLPIELSPGETRAVSIHFRFTDGPGLFARRAQLLIEDVGIRRISLRWTGRSLSAGVD
jgi:hypothetical protein